MKRIQGLNEIETHEYKIAKSVLNTVDAMVPVLCPYDKDEAKAIVKRLDEKRLYFALYNKVLED